MSWQGIRIQAAVGVAFCLLAGPLATLAVDSIPGDVNCDSAVTFDDFLPLTAELVDGDGTSVADVSGGDVFSCSGADANGDGAVNSADLSALLLLISRSPLASSGPQITFFGVAAANGHVTEPVIDGRVPVFQRPGGFGFYVVVEASRGANGLPVGQHLPPTSGTTDGNSDLQIVLSRNLGNGSPATCDAGGVPGIVPPNFGPDRAALSAITDLACRFRVAVNPLAGCTVDPFGTGAFARPDSAVQFCLFVASTEGFPELSTMLSARILDNAGNPGAASQMIVHVGTEPLPTWSPSPSPSWTPRPRPSATATPSRAIPSPTPTPTGTITSTRVRTHTGTPTYTFGLSPTTIRTATATPMATHTRTRTSTSTRTQRTLTPTLTPLFSFTLTATRTRTASPTVSRSVTATHTASRTVPVPTSSPSVTSSRTFTRTATPSPSRTLTRTPTVPEPTSTATRPGEPTLTRTVAPTVTPTPTRSRTFTASPTGTRPTATYSPVRTVTQTRSPTASPTATPTVTQSQTTTVTMDFTATRTFSSTRTPTRTRTPTMSDSPTTTRRPTFTATNTPTVTATPTGTNTYTPRPTRSPTTTETATRTPIPTLTRTVTLSPVPTMTHTHTRTRPPTSTRTPTTTTTSTRTRTRTVTQTYTLTQTPSRTPTLSPTVTLTRTATLTPTETLVPTLSRTPTVTLTPSITPTPSETRTPTITRSPTVTRTITPTVRPGPDVNFVGIARGGDQIVPPDSFTPEGIPIFRRLLGFGFYLVVECKPGPSGRPCGVGTFQWDPGDSAQRPDLQIIVSRPLGDGSTLVCDNEPPIFGGIPASAGFDDSQASADAINDLGCRFLDGSGQPVGRPSGEACTRSPDGEYRVVGAGSTVQYCATIGQHFSFPVGDTLVSIRIRDTTRALSPMRQMIIRVAP